MDGSNIASFNLTGYNSLGNTFTDYNGIIYNYSYDNNNYYYYFSEQFQNTIGNNAFNSTYNNRFINLIFFTISDNVNSIGDDAFNFCRNLSSINIPYGVTDIGSSAFSNCNNLSSITIPNTVTTIGIYVFENSGLSNITIENSIIGSSMFSSCGNLSSVTIPNTVTTIGNDAFAYSGLSNITIENSIIGSYMFSGCSNLSSITIPNTVTSIGNNAFSGSGLSNITIENSIIGSRMFSGCSNLSSITIPNTVTSIGNSAFSQCNNLTSVTFNSTNIPTLDGNVFTNSSINSTAYVPYGTSQINIDNLITNGIQNVVVESSPLLPCFLINSTILTDKGYKFIEELRKGDLIKTLKNGYLPIVLIGKSPIYNSGDSNRIKNRLYTLSKDKYKDLTEDLVLTGCHSLLVDTIREYQFLEMGGEEKRLYVTDDKLRLFTYLDKNSEPYSKKGTFTIYHLALENDNYIGNYGIWANGLLVESCSIRYLKELSGMELIE